MAALAAGSSSHVALKSGQLRQHYAQERSNGQKPVELSRVSWKCALLGTALALSAVDRTTRGKSSETGVNRLPLSRVIASIADADVARASAPENSPAGRSFNVVITGSTKGIGLALAKEFLRSGDRVIVCSRSGERVDDVVSQLQNEFGTDRVAGIACDVAKADDVQSLADFATATMGHVDIWINNAGSNAYEYAPLIDTGDAAIEEIVRTNVLGVMLCCRQAMKMMRQQAGGGHIFNMDGAGADGNPTPRFAAYGATKRGLAQFTKSLQAELKMLDVKNVVVHNLSPGMVTTDLLMAGANTPQAKFFINALAEPAEEVAQYLVPRVREVPTSGSNRSTYIRYLTGPKAYSQIFARLLFQQRKNRYVPED